MTPIIFLVLTIVLIALVLPVGRSVMGWLFAKPGVALFTWIVVVFRFVFDAHACIVRNLFLPRKVIFPTLEREDTVQRK